MIVTFYSYKGGVGRTQLMANLAAYLCYQKDKKILLIDWDLEAPGVHFYFKKGNEDITNRGLLEVFQDYCKVVRSAENLQQLKIEDFPKFTQENIVSMVDASLLPPNEKQEVRTGKIDLLPAGRYSETEEYKRNVIDFDWYEFYETLDGKRYIEYIKKELKNLDYDYIFIDSRTGLSDYSNICNIQLPEVNILVIAPTHQNLEGCLQVAKNIVNSPYVTSRKFRKGIVLPVLSRVEIESPDFEPFFYAYQEKYGFLIENLRNQFIDNQRISDEIRLRASSYFSDSLLGYNKFIAIGENILFSERQGMVRGLGESYLFIAEFIRVFNEKDNKLNGNKNYDVDRLLELLESGNFIQLFEELDRKDFKDPQYYALKKEFMAREISSDFIERLRVFISNLSATVHLSQKSSFSTNL